MPHDAEYPLANGSNVKLGKWLDRQRRRMKTDKLKGDRSDKLQHLVDEGKLKWEVDRYDDEAWNMQYDAMVEYGEEHGHCNVPQNVVYTLTDGRDVKLWYWLKDQREYYKLGKLKGDRLDKLQQLVDEGKLGWVRKSSVFKHSKKNSITRAEEQSTSEIEQWHPEIDFRCMKSPPIYST